MKRVHLLRVAGEPAVYASLIESVRADGGRVGWLELAPSAPSAAPDPEPLPARLGQAADLGVLRAVAVGSRRTVAVKPRRGQTVVRDLLREHFRGCRAVLVSGEVDAPLLIAEGGSWTVRIEGAERRHTTESLVRALRKPRPFGEPSESDTP